MTTHVPEPAMLANMKTTILAILLTVTSAFAQQATPIEKKLQQALFAEEGTRDLDAAIEAYHAVIKDYDSQRKFAATAIFRLAECHRKKGQEEEAVAAYQRLLREFPDETTLCRLAQENLAALGAAPGDAENLVPPSSEPAEIARIQKLVALSPDLINDPETGLLHQAATQSQLEVARYLIESGADVNLVAKGNTPLEPAAGGGHLAMTELLLSNGAELSERAFEWAVMNQRTAVLDKLLERLPDNRAGLLGDALQAAAERGRADYLKKLIDRGATPDHLGRAVNSGDLESVRVLLDAGAEPDDAAVVLAIRGTAVADAKSAGEIFDLIWEGSNRPALALRVALDDASDEELALKILESLDDIEGEDGLGTTPLGYVAYRCSPKLARAAISRGADPNAKDAAGNTPLFWAITSEPYSRSSETHQQDLVKVIDLLIRAGANVDEKRPDGDSLIAIIGRGGVMNGGTYRQPFIPDEATKLLLATGPDPQLNPDANLPEARNELVRRYATLRMDDRGEQVWKVTTRDRGRHAISSRPMRLSELLLGRYGPDQKIRIYPPGKTQAQVVDYQAIIEAGDPAADPLLALGAVVEIDPDHSAEAADHPEIYDFLQRAAAKRVTVSRGEHRWEGEARPGDRPPHVYDPSMRTVYTTTVQGLLSSIWAPVNSSDLTRIEITHSDGETSTLNLLADDMPLRDGDHITLYPLASASLREAIWISRESDLFLYPLGKRPTPTDGFPPLNLAEFLYVAFSNENFVLPRPDLDRITLRGSEGEVVSLDELVAKKGELATLAGGTIIEIPPLDAGDSTWTELAEPARQKLAKILARKTTFEIQGGSERQVKIGPQFYHFPIGDNGLRSIEPTATPGDDEFEILGLSAPTAIRKLGYVPTKSMEIRYAVKSSHENTSPAGPLPYLTVPHDGMPAMPIIGPDTRITIQMRGISTTSRTSRPPLPKRASSAQSRPPVPGSSNKSGPQVPQALIDALNKANADSQKKASGSTRARSRRVVLPPPNR